MNHLGWICDMLTGGLFILSLGEYATSFTCVDIMLVSLSLVSIETKAVDRSLLHAFFYAFAFNTDPGVLQALNILLLFGYDMRSALIAPVGFLLGNPGRTLYYLGMLGVCAALETAAYFLVGRNIRRKLFHVAGFFLFLDLPAPVFVILQHVLYGLVLLSMTEIPGIVFSGFTSSRDFGKGVYSHILLAMGLMCPSLYLGRSECVKALISLCFMDAFASISGTYFRSRGKSWIGFLGGQVSALAAEYAVLGTADYRYHAVAGLAERLASTNDNIAIPICSILYFRGI